MDNEIGLIGVGLLGSALAERLTAGGFAVIGFDLDSEQLRRAAVTAAGSANEVVERCRRTVLCLPNSEIVRTVVQQTWDVLREGDVLIDTTTGDPAASAEIGQRLWDRQVDYLDATVAGSSEQARRADITLMVGGRGEAVSAQDDLFRSWSSQVFHLGSWGAGAEMKLVVNLVLGLNRAALAEGLALAKSCGLQLEKALDVLRSGAAYSFAMDAKGRKMVEEDFAAQARLDQHLKDVRLIQDLARRVGATTPLGDVHRNLLEAASAKGFGAADNSAVIKAYL